MALLGVNIDHVATLRQARKEEDPDPIEAARICEKAGANSIVVHLREDRRHIQDRDVLVLRKTIKTRLNLEMSIQPKIVEFACMVCPDQVTLVPERRQELTTEGGLDVRGQRKQLSNALSLLKKSGIKSSLFIDPDKTQIDACLDLGVGTIEIHTGHYAKAYANRDYAEPLDKIIKICTYAQKKGIVINAGHGLNYENVQTIAQISGMHELNIGHAIVSKAVFIGLKDAVKRMVNLIK